jgi:zinc/manganese transport system ATP-binding protein
MSPALRLEKVAVTLDGRSLLEDVSFEVARGEFCCLCGPNGGGKTTLLKTILGLVPLASGAIEVLGLPPQRARGRVGYLPQVKSFNPGFPSRPLEMIVANHRGSWPLRVSESERELARTQLARVGGERLLEASCSGSSWPAPSSTSLPCCCSTNQPPESTRAGAPSSWSCSPPLPDARTSP